MYHYKGPSRPEGTDTEPAVSVAVGTVAVNWRQLKCYKKREEALVVASKWVDVGVNGEEAKLVFLSLNRREKTHHEGS